MIFKLKVLIANILKTKYPRVFDLIKRLSRIYDRNEIYVLLTEYAKNRNEIHLLQIGANDGISNDPVREFIVQSPKWHAYLVEPIENCLISLRKNYRWLLNSRVFIQECAVSDRNYTGELYKVKEEFRDIFPDYSSQIASFSKNHIIKHFPKIQDDMIGSEKVEFRSIASILMDNNVSDLDIVCIDVEGAESELIHGFPFHTHTPKIFIYESIHLSDEASQKLKEYFIGLDYSHFTFKFDSMAIVQDQCLNWKKRYIKFKSQ